MNIKLIRKKLVLVMMIVIIASSFCVSFASTFSDLGKAEWASPVILKWNNFELVSGYKDGTFKPNTDITRAEFAVIAYKAFDLESNGSIEFEDVKASDWYYKQVVGLAKLEYIKGYTDGTFKPNKLISRAEAAAMIASIQRLTANEEGVNMFVDNDTIPNWARSLVGASAEAKYITGYSDETFRPCETITRAETVAMLNNAVYSANYLENSWRVVEKGVYGGTIEKPVTIKGNVYIKSANVELKNVVIEGKLIFGREIGEGNATIENVVVKGDTKVYGGGINSIYIKNSNLTNLFIVKENNRIRIVAQGSTEIGSTLTSSGVILQEISLTTGTGFTEVNIDRFADLTVEFIGLFDEIKIDSPRVKALIPEGSDIKSLVLNAPVIVTGGGTIDTAVVSVKGISFENAPKFIEADSLVPIVVEVAGKSTEFPANETTATGTPLPTLLPPAPIGGGVTPPPVTPPPVTPPNGNLSITLKGSIADISREGLSQFVVKITDKSNSQFNNQIGLSVQFKNGLSSYMTLINKEMPANHLYKFVIFDDVNVNNSHDIGEKYAIVDNFLFAGLDTIEVNFDLNKSQPSLYSTLPGSLNAYPSIPYAGYNSTINLRYSTDFEFEKGSVSFILPEAFKAYPSDMIFISSDTTGASIESMGENASISDDGLVVTVFNIIFDNFKFIELHLQNQLLPDSIGSFTFSAVGDVDGIGTMYAPSSGLGTESDQVVTESGGTISGTISLENGALAPKGGVDVFIDAISPPTVSVMKYTIPEGKNSIEYNLLIQENDYKINCHNNVYSAYYNASGNVSDLSSASMLDLSNGDFLSVNFVIPSIQTIEGTITLPDNYVAPSGGIDITIDASNGNKAYRDNIRILEGTSDAYYSIDVPIGDYKVSYNLNNGTFINMGYYNIDEIVYSYNQASLIHVTSSSNKVANFNIKKGNTISGTVSLPEGQIAPSNGISVYISAGNNVFSFSKSVVITEGNNSVNYSIQVPNGDYRIQYSLNNGTFINMGYYNIDEIVYNYDQASLLNVTSSSNNVANFNIEKGNTISGTVSLPEGQIAPRNGISINISAGNNVFSFSKGVVITEGNNSVNYSVQVPYGDYRIHYSLNDEKFIKSGYYNNGEIVYSSNQASLLNITSSSNNVVNFSIVEGKTISGTVSLPEGQIAPSTGISVVIYTSNNDSSFLGSTVITEGHNSANYSIRVPNGDYSIYYNVYNESLVESGYYNLGSITQDAMSASYISVNSTDVLGVDFTLVAGYILSGTVSLPVGEIAPTEGIEVRIMLFENQKSFYDYVLIEEGFSSSPYSIRVPSGNYKLNYYLQRPSQRYLEYGFYKEGDISTSSLNASSLNLQTQGLSGIDFEVVKLNIAEIPIIFNGIIKEQGKNGIYNYQLKILDSNKPILNNQCELSLEFVQGSAEYTVSSDKEMLVGNVYTFILFQDINGNKVIDNGEEYSVVDNYTCTGSQVINLNFDFDNVDSIQTEQGILRIYSDTRISNQISDIKLYYTSTQEFINGSVQFILPAGFSAKETDTVYISSDVVVSSLLDLGENATISEDGHIVTIYNVLLESVKNVILVLNDITFPAPGEYTFSVIADRDGEQTSYSPSLGSNTESQTFTLQNRQTISGKISLPEGEVAPPGGISVSISSVVPYSFYKTNAFIPAGSSSAVYTLDIDSSVLSIYLWSNQIMYQNNIIAIISPESSTINFDLKKTNE